MNKKERKDYFGPKIEFIREVKEELKKNGFTVTLDDTKVIVFSVFNVIREQYFLKLREFQFRGFGTFSFKIQEKFIKINTHKNTFNKVHKFIRYHFKCSENIKKKNMKLLKEVDDEQ